MSIAETIQKIEAAGFHLAVDGADLVVTPPGKLSDQQRQYLKVHKAEIITTLLSSESLLEAGQSGNDIEAANDRVLIHVPEYQTQSGKRYLFDMTVPRINLPKLRHSLRFELIENQGGGSILGLPGQTESELHDRLVQKYGTRLASIDGHAIH